ncbi:MAG: YihY/virulence factor BrkB family protein [Actinomycetota bacterium]
MNPLQRSLDRIDAVQQRHTWLAFPFAVFKKFGDDRAGNLAALIAYYGFFSLFPLLLVFVTIVSMVIAGNPELQRRIIDSAVSQFPIVGEQIAKNVHGIKGSGFALAVGAIGALWGGLGVVQAAENAMNRVWNVPLKDRPNFLKSRVRAILMLVVLGAFVLCSAVLSGLSSSAPGLGTVLQVVAIVGSIALNLVVFLAAFRILTAEDLTWGDVLPGALCAAAAWSALQYLGTYLVAHQLKNASAVYGLFAVVIGLLWWIYLGAQITILSAEVNVIRKRRLWPRSLAQPPLTDADKRTLAGLAKEQEKLQEQEVDVHFSEGGGSQAATDNADGASSNDVSGAEDGAAREPTSPRSAKR